MADRIEELENQGVPKRFAKFATDYLGSGNDKVDISAYYDSTLSYQENKENFSRTFPVSDMERLAENQTKREQKDFDYRAYVDRAQQAEGFGAEEVDKRNYEEMSPEERKNSYQFERIERVEGVNKPGILDSFKEGIDKLRGRKTMEKMETVNPKADAKAKDVEYSREEKDLKHKELLEKVEAKQKKIEQKEFINKLEKEKVKAKQKKIEQKEFINKLEKDAGLGRGQSQGQGQGGYVRQGYIGNDGKKHYRYVKTGGQARGPVGIRGKAIAALSALGTMRPSGPSRPPLGQPKLIYLGNEGKSNYFEHLGGGERKGTPRLIYAATPSQPISANKKVNMQPTTRYTMLANKGIPTAHAISGNRIRTMLETKSPTQGGMARYQLPMQSKGTSTSKIRGMIESKGSSSGFFERFGKKRLV
jgi:hypothetical protein